jgi:hypothetical protein
MSSHDALKLDARADFLNLDLATDRAVGCLRIHAVLTTLGCHDHNAEAESQRYNAATVGSLGCRHVLFSLIAGRRAPHAPFL